MKKLFLVVALCLCLFTTVHAQEENAVGLRFGDGVELLYQRDLDAKNFFAVLVGISAFRRSFGYGNLQLEVLSMELDTPNV